MGWVPPPRPLTQEEFHKRYEDGARTMEELDPELHAWNLAMRRQIFMRIIAGVVFVVAFIIVVTLFILKGPQ